MNDYYPGKYKIEAINSKSEVLPAIEKERMEGSKQVSLLYQFKYFLGQVHTLQFFCLFFAVKMHIKKKRIKKKMHAVFRKHLPY